MCNALIQTHFGYGCIFWFTLLNKNLKHKPQAAQNRCLLLCLDLSPYFRKINWLPVSKRVEPCISTTLLKYWNGIVSLYMFKPSHSMCNNRLQMALVIHLQNANTRKQALSFLGPKIWTTFSHSARIVKAMACFTHTLKKEILNKLCR